MLRQAVVLVGGLGTRLGERTRSTPKPLLPVSGKPFLTHLLEEITRFDCFDRVLLLAGYLAEDVAELYDGQRFGRARVSVSVEPQPLGTAGALSHARQQLDDIFVLFNGDSFLDFNILDFAHVTLADDEIGRLALLADRPGERYGRVRVAGDRISAFLPAGSDPSLPINGGVYLLRKTIVDQVDHMPSSLEAEVFVQMAEQGRLSARTYRGTFIDIGIPADLARADASMGGWRQRPAVFFDRDGVLNVDVGYAHRPEQITWISGAREAVKACNDAGYFTFVVTNQGGIARGYYGEAEVLALHEWMQRELAAMGGHIDAFAYCPHHPEGSVEPFNRICSCRKPAAGMVTTLLSSWPIDAARSLLVGDKGSDLEAAHRANIKSHLFDGTDLAAFVTLMLSHQV
ncbi:MAG: HAD-IIIA family hydrolase [Candidatus Devosia symbiotica]|nr:HAD-IIIA family hydrolase [Candidatus Devosia symbiotica]